MTSKEYFNSLNIIYTALMSAQILFAFITLYLNSNGQSSREEDLNETFKILAPLFVIGGLMGSIFLISTRLKSIKKKTELKEKLVNYRSTVIVKFALLEFPSLFGILCYLLTLNYYFLALAGLMLTALFSNKPSKAKAISDLELDQTEISVIKNPEAIIV